MKPGKRKVVYTSVTGGYDALLPPLAPVPPDWDFVCFTDSDPSSLPAPWKGLPLPGSSEMPLSRRSRLPKILPHRYLQDWDWSFWIDANIEIAGEGLFTLLDCLISESEEKGGNIIYQVRHPKRDCAFEEAVRCYLNRRISYREARKTVLYLRAAGLPRHFGLWENNLILRKHSDPLTGFICDQWWEEYSSHSRRDQLSLPLVYWRNSFLPGTLLPEEQNSMTCPYLRWHPHSGGGRLYPEGLLGRILGRWRMFRSGFLLK